MSKINITIDDSRLKSEVEKYQKRAEQVARFATDRLGQLAALQPRLEAFAEAVKATEISVQNMYSTHFDEEQYTDDASLIAWIVFKPKKFYKRQESAIESYREAFKAITGLSGSHYRVRQEKGIIEFQTWIK